MPSIREADGTEPRTANRGRLLRTVPVPLLVAPVGASPLVGWAGSSDGVVPEDGASRVVFVIIGIVILGLYVLISRTKRRSASHYLSRRRREQELRNADPDMRTDEV